MVKVWEFHKLLYLHPGENWANLNFVLVFKKIFFFILPFKMLNTIYK